LSKFSTTVARISLRDESSASLHAKYPFRFRAIAVGVLFLAAGCTTMAKVTNLSEESCRVSFTRQLSAILTAEGEQSAVDALAAKTVSTLSTYDLGPRPFTIAAPSGTDYRFIVRHKGTDCVLTLYGRRKGFVSYTNNLTHIATQPLPGCTCIE
jgi:hypothetical protein